MANEPQALPDAGGITVDRNVSGPIGLAAGEGQVYLVYQLATGEVYATTTTDSGTFPARMSRVSGGSLPQAAGACGPGIAFDMARQRVLVSYPSADGQNVVVAGTDPELETGWSYDGLLPLFGSQVQPGLPMVAGEFSGVAATILYAVIAGSSKVVFAASPNVWGGGLQSATLDGNSFNPPNCAGLAPSMQGPHSGQVALGYTIGTQAFVALSGADDPGDFSGVVALPKGMTTALAPGLMLQPDTGAWWALTNTGQVVYYSIYSASGWKEPGPLFGLPSGMSGAPVDVWNGLTGYVACVGAQGTLYCTKFAIG